MFKALVATLLYYVAATLLYFLSAGCWDLPLAWLYFVINFAIGFGLVVFLGVKDPGLLQERLKPAAGKQDKLYRPFATTLALFS